MVSLKVALNDIFSEMTSFLSEALNTRLTKHHTS